MKTYFALTFVLLLGILSLAGLQWDPYPAIPPASRVPREPAARALTAARPGWNNSFYLPVVLNQSRPPADPCRELITNSSFETDDGWLMPATSSMARYTTAVQRSGGRSLQLGLLPTQAAATSLPGHTVPARATHSSAYQTLFVPADVDVVTFNFWYYPGSEDVADGDYQQVLILDGTSAHQALESVLRLHADSPGWHAQRVDMTAYRGRWIDIAFEVYNDSASGGGRTWLYVDDASLQGCTVPTATLTPTASPTQTGTSTSTPAPSATNSPSPTSTWTVTSEVSPTATGSQTPTSTETPSPTPAATDTPTLTPLPPGCEEHLLNGSFETDDRSWIFPLTGSQAGYSSATYHSGRRSLSLGLTPVPQAPDPGQHLPAAGSYSKAYQALDLPAGARSVTLRFWYNGGSEDAPGGVDYQDVLLLDTVTSQLLGEPMRVRENDRTWKVATFDLSALSARNFTLYFQVYNDSTGPAGRTWMYVDDASIVTCQ